MNKMYSERNGLRKPVTKTSIINARFYSLLWDCCERYKDNIAERFPEYCDSYSHVICGVNEEAFQRFLTEAIPGLILGQPTTSTFDDNPWEDNNETKGEHDNYYLILDYIELIAQEMQTVKREVYNKDWSLYQLSFSCDDNKDFKKFEKEINELFEICGLQYQLTEERIVERIVDDGFLIEESKPIIEAMPEKELKKLVEEAIALHKSRKQEDHHLATEKIWDAFERLRSYYIKEEKDKKASANRIIDEISQGDSVYKDLFTKEFLELGAIGNNYRIRHSEIGKTDIPNDDYFDYFFSRCFAMIVLALKYIKG